jgi:hypothetical protein
MTLTFPDNVTDNKEASRRWNSFKTNYLSKHPAYGEWIHVKERQKRGAWHYHIIVVLKGDIRSGVNWEEMQNGVYTSASPYLRELWRDLRENLEKYGFGRSELLPVRSNENAMARYIGKYISKHIDQRAEDDKGVRLVNYSRDWVKNSMKFAWNNENSHEWRRKLSLFAKFVGCTELYQLQEKLGQGWAYNYADYIVAIDEILTQCKIDGEKFDKTDVEYVPPVVKMVREKMFAKQKKLESSLSLHVGPTEMQKMKREARKEVAKSLRELPAWLDEWRLYAVKYENQIEKEDKWLRDAYYEKSRAADSCKVAEFLMEEIGMDIQAAYVKEGERAGELVPF